MIEPVAFDPHRFAERMTESGFTKSQAGPLAEEHVGLHNANLTIKTDIARLVAGIETLRQETKAGIARGEAVKADLLEWILGMLIAQGGLVVALVKLL